MSHFKRFALRLFNVVRGARADDELSRELEAHLRLMQDEFERRGMSADQARLAARRAFGGLEQAKEQQRDARSFVWLEDARRDVGYALRTLVRSPGFTLTAVLSLALGIGANAAIFSLVDAVLLRMVPVAEPRQLVEVTRQNGGTVSYSLYETIRARNEVFSGVFCMSSGRYAASARLGAIDAGDVHVSLVSGDYFNVLGVHPVIGRSLDDADLMTANTTVIGYDLWQRAFGGDPEIVGKALRLGSRPHTIVGVAPAGFRGISVGQPMDVWVPLTYMGRNDLKNGMAFTFRVVGRRLPAASNEQVLANMTVLARQWGTEWKLEQPLQMEVVSASGGLTQLRRRFSRPLAVVMTVVALLLLIATANVANLLLARASARQREIGVRLSLGASRSRLIRQLLTESALLALAGGALGLIAAPAAAAFLVRFLSSAVGRFDFTFGVDGQLLTFTVVAAFVAVLIFGLVPALAATRPDLSSLLKGRATADGAARIVARPGKLVVVAQVAISCVLLVIAMLFARSLGSLTHLDAGFRRENVLLFGVYTEGSGMTGAEHVRLYERLRQRFASLPGVRSAAVSSESLFGGGTWTEPVSTAGFNPAPGQDREAVLLVVSPEFFRTMDTPVLRGREFEARDDDRSTRVAIVNEATARYFFGDGDPVGRTLRVEANGFPDPLTVVGVVKDAKYRSLKDPAPRMVYLCYLQAPGAAGGNFAIRTIADSEYSAHALWKQASAESSALRLGNSTTQARLVLATIAQDRMLAQLSSAFGIAAACLVCLGLYGLTAYDVSRRTKEIGIRMALGAQHGEVVQSVVRGAVLLVGIGTVLGLAASAAMVQLIEGLLFGVRPTGWQTFAATAALLVGIGAAAAYWPARRAARVDPMIALRVE
jgi:predicted permease